MASSDSQIDKPQRGHPKRAELPDVNINTSAQSAFSHTDNCIYLEIKGLCNQGNACTVYAYTESFFYFCPAVISSLPFSDGLLSTESWCYIQIIRDKRQTFGCLNTVLVVSPTAHDVASVHVVFVDASGAIDDHSRHLYGDLLCRLSSQTRQAAWKNLYRIRRIW